MGTSVCVAPCNCGSVYNNTRTELQSCTWDSADHVFVVDGMHDDDDDDEDDLFLAAREYKFISYFEMEQLWM